MPPRCHSRESGNPSRSHPRKSFLIPTIICLAILLSLGIWQVKRAIWKDHIIAQISAGMNAPPETSVDLEAWVTDVAQKAYHPLQLTGSFVNGAVIHVGPKTNQERTGYHVYALFKPTGSAEALWINCGWRPTLVPPHVWLKGPYTLVLRLDPPQEPGSFTPENVPGKNQWYWAELASMNQTVQTPAFSTAYGQLISNTPDLSFEANQTCLLVLPPNRHKEYAITWFLLAICVSIAGIYGTFSERNKKPS
jgi:surfeit locus 1 family protein